MAVTLFEYPILGTIMNREPSLGETLVQNNVYRAHGQIERLWKVRMTVGVVQKVGNVLLVLTNLIVVTSHRFMIWIFHKLTRIDLILFEINILEIDFSVQVKLRLVFKMMFETRAPIG